MSIATAEKIASDAEERSQQLAQRRAAMEAAFHQIAQGRPWYEGTGNDDAIFPHQWYGACYGAAAKRWFLGDEPGAGKTRTSIAWAALTGARKIVLVAEANVCAQFAGEIMALEPSRTILNLAGLAKDTRHERLNAMLRTPEAVVVVNYELIRLDKEALGKIQMWQADTLIVDEAHNMKDTRTKNYQAIEGLAFANNTCPECSALVYGLAKPCSSCGWNIGNIERDDVRGVKGLRIEGYFHTPKSWASEASTNKTMFFSTRSVKNVLLLTGTPILNTPVDLYGIYHIIDPITFPSLSWFKATFTHPDYSAKRSVFSKRGLEEITKLLKGRFLQRTLSEVGIELPKQHIHIERVELDPKRYPGQARVIEQVSKHAALMLTTGEKATLMHIIAIILRKRQANVWPGGIKVTDDAGVVLDIGSEVQESCKMDAAQERIMEHHAKGHRQIVFSQFQTALVEFEKRLKAQGLRVARFDGSTPSKLREEIKSNFYKAKGEVAKWDVVLVHYKTGGAGLNLTAATATHILDEEWNAGRRDQAYARNHRMGQDQETDVHVYRIPGTVDTWMANLITMKERMVQKLGEAMSAEKMIGDISRAIRKGEM